MLLTAVANSLQFIPKLPSPAMLNTVLSGLATLTPIAAPKPNPIVPSPPDEIKKEMKKVLTEIQDGTFARNWLMENQVGRPQFNAMRRMEAEHPIEKVGKELREMMSWIDTKNLD